MIETYLEILNLKEEKRTGWEIYNTNEEELERVAGHSWSVALLTLIHLPEKLDMEKALKLAIIHDVGEARTGDVPNRATTDKKEAEEQKEREAVKEFSGKLQKPEILEFYEEYKSKSTEEARFVKDMDILDLALQTLKYERTNNYQTPKEVEYENLDEFMANAEKRLQTAKGERLFEEVRKKYEIAKSN